MQYAENSKIRGPIYYFLKGKDKGTFLLNFMTEFIIKICNEKIRDYTRHFYAVFMQAV